MTKKIFKFLLTLLFIIVTISSLSICYAEVDGDKTKTVTKEEATTTSENTEATEQEIHNGDLYVFDTNIVMDKLVDGNVFLFGNNVEVKGQVNGNLFVFANNVSFNESYIRYSIFACANKVYYNGACNDLYVSTNNLEMTYESYIVRDLKALSSKAIIKSAIGRDVDLSANTIDFGEGENIPVIYGNLRYSANKELTIPEGIIAGEGNVTYTKPSEATNNVSSSITDILIGFATCIVTVLIIYIITKKCTPKFAEKLSNRNLSALNLLKAFGIGLASLIIVIVAFLLLLITTVGLKLGFILFLIYAILCLIAVPSLAIAITNLLKPSFKIEKTSMFYLILILVSIVLYGFTLIPVVGGFLGFVIKMIAIGLIIDMFIPYKELTEEEKIAIQEAKKQAKEIKEKKKQERLEAKEVKKQEKLEAKEAKKKEENK